MRDHRPPSRRSVRRPAATGLPATAGLLTAALLLAACQGERPPGQAGGAPGQADAAPRPTFATSEVTRGLGLPFSEVARHGDLLLLSGMVGVRAGTTELVEGGLEAEARRALENLRLMLAEVGARPDDVLRCTVMMDDIGQWGRFNEIYVAFFGDHRPARSAFGADGLALGAAVEIQCTAAVPTGQRAP